MILLNDFFVRYKEAVSNQMELILRANKGKIISATRFMNQKALQGNDKKDNIYVYSPFIYPIIAIKEIKQNPNEIVHVFEEEPCLWKRVLINKSGNPLYISMYRRPDEKYVKHLRKYKNLKKVFVELEKHKEILIQYGLSEEKICVTPTPSKIGRKRSEKAFNPQKINILFASWNNKEENAIVERGLEFLLGLLKQNKEFSLTIPLRDNDTLTFKRVAEEYKVWDRVHLLDINNSVELLTKLFDDSDFVCFVPQERIVKDVPNSLIDGLVRGKPLIISDVIDFSEIVSKEKMGYVIKKGETPKRLEISIEEYENMRQKAYQYSKYHSSESYINIIKSMYNVI